MFTLPCLKITNKQTNKQTNRDKKNLKQEDILRAVNIKNVYVNVKFVYTRNTKDLLELVQKCSCIPGSNSNLEIGWFLKRGENRCTRRRTSWSRVENQQTQPTYGSGSENRIRDSLVGGERSHHCTKHVPQYVHNIEQVGSIY